MGRVGGGVGKGTPTASQGGKAGGILGNKKARGRLSICGSSCRKVPSRSSMAEQTGELCECKVDTEQSEAADQRSTPLLRQATS